MTRGARRKPVNPWQTATALARILRVRQPRPGVVEWHHPTIPDLRYVIAYGEPAGGEDVAWWRLTRAGDIVDWGTMHVSTAVTYAEHARNIEPRRLAAWQMVNYLARTEP